MIGVVDTSALIRLFIPDGPLPAGFDEFMRRAERGNLLGRAVEMARKHDLTVYDALYLALAEDRGAVVFSADQRVLDVAGRLSLRPE